MGKFLLWWLINALSLFFVAWLLPGVHVAGGWQTVALVALLIGVINATLRPILYILSCGLIVLTLGLMIPVINALLLLLASEIAGDAFQLDSFWWAFLAAFIMGIVNSILHNLIDDDDEAKRKKESHAR